MSKPLFIPDTLQGEISADELQISELRALVWRQPYASMMLHGKQETRTWGTKYRGLVLICAALKVYEWEGVEKISGDYWRSIAKIAGALKFLQTGRAIGVARLVDVVPMSEALEGVTYVKNAPGLFVHKYANVRPIQPFAWKGAQGWRTVTPEQKSKIILI